MATITMMKSATKVDGSIRSSVFSTLEKLAEDDTAPGLHVEPLQRAADKRIRSIRVNKMYRMLAFKIEGGEQPHYIYVGTYEHEEAYRVGEGLALRVNPVNGVMSLLREQSAAAESEKPESQAKAEKAAEEARAAAEAAADTAAEVPVEEPQNIAVAPPVPAPPESPSEVFAAGGHSVSSLEAQLGIHGELLEPALSARTPEELESRLVAASPWERDALIGLAAGMSVADVQKDLGLDVEPAASDNDDASVRRALEKPATQMEFANVSSDELKAIIESGSFEEWTTFLHPSQRTVAYRSLGGSSRVSGGAGTGKTVVALHRARALFTETLRGQQKTESVPRVFLTTFTNSLSASLQSSLAVLDSSISPSTRIGEPGIAVLGIDKATMFVLNHAAPAELQAAGQAVLGAPLRTAPKPLVNPANTHLWSDAIDRTPSASAEPAITPDFLAAEFETIILPNRISTKAQYLKANRAGRGVALNRKARLAVWSIVEAYLSMATSANTHTFPVLGALAAAALDARAEAGGGRLVDHVVVDEAQDFHAGHWRFLRALVAEGPNDIFISEDSHQRIYGHPLRLSHFGIKIVGRSTRLKLNYRTTAETLRFAMQVLGSETYTDTLGEADSIEGYRSARSGPLPVVVREDNLTAELDGVAAKIEEWLARRDDATVGVLTRNRHDIDTTADGLEKRGIELSDKDGKGVSVMTMHSAKGLEFNYVALVDVSQRTMPSKIHAPTTPESERHEMLQREKSLLYVASSRARDELFVSTGRTPAEVLPAGSVPAPVA